MARYAVRAAGNTLLARCVDWVDESAKRLSGAGKGVDGRLIMDRQAEEFNRSLAEGAWLLRTNQPDAAVEKLLPLYEQAHLIRERGVVA